MEIADVLVFHYSADDIVRGLLSLEKSTLHGPSIGTEGTEHKRRRVDDGDQSHPTGEDEDNDLSSRRRSLYIEGQLHTNDVDRVLASAPTPKVAAAWQEGKAVPGLQHRFKVEEFVGTQDVEDDDAEDPSWVNAEATQALYDQGKEWWEEG